MRPAIEVLPDHVVDQIAAGEVVERPASVVKELVENALDAGARQVIVEIEGGGRDLVRVTDDGCGMTADEAMLALRRHATSKLRAVDDLFGISTMGFRGEALPSIAAVSRMSLRTRTRDQVAGALIRIEGGEVLEQSETGAPVGTRIEVRDLLYNVPARQKFMKGRATEASHITDAVTKLALAHPDVHVRLVHGGRASVTAPAHADRLERARVLLGPRLGRRLHRVTGSENGIEVEALLAAPELAQTTSRGTQMFVGRRAVRDWGLLHAIAMGYGELVPRGRYPVCVLFIDVPGEAVNVNVHPQKLEVRFSDAQAVYAAVRHTIAHGVAGAPWLSEPAPAAAPVRMRAIAQAAPPRRAPSGDLAADYAQRRAHSLWGRAREVAQVSFPLARPTAAPVAPAADVSAPAAPRAAAAAVGSAPAASPAVATAEAPGFFSHLRYLGQLDKTYLLCETDGELVLIDQHAAHERVAFQRLRERYQERDIPVQRLLFPRTLDLDPSRAAVAQESADQLAAVGFELEPFGGDTFALKATPAGLRGADPEPVLVELLDELAESGGSRAVDERLDLVLATIACHSVVRAGDSLSSREADALLRSMDEVDYSAHCPHGRPVLLRISVAEIARRFGR